MSLNQILLEGKIGEGLDLEVKSVSTDAAGGSLFRGDLTVAGISTLQGTVTAEDSLSIVGTQENFGVKTDHRVVTVFSGASGVVALTVGQYVDSIIILDATFTGSFTTSLTNVVDAYIGGSPTDGTVFKCTVINRSAAETTLSNGEYAAQFVPAQASATASSCTDLYFQRIAGFWTGLNS